MGMDMRKYIIAWSILIISTTSSFAQGTIQFNNIVTGTVRAPIYGYDPQDSGTVLRGNPPSGTPPGTTVYGGAPLAGTGFSVQVFGGSTSTSESALVAASAALHFRTNLAVGFIDNAFGLIATVPGVPEGQTAHIQLRAWDNQSGTILTWEQAVANPLRAMGTSAMFVSQPLGGAFTDAPPMIGLTSFNIATAGTVPEPGTVAMGILGLGAVLFFRRK